MTVPRLRPTAAFLVAALLAGCSSAIDGGIAEPMVSAGPATEITAAGVGGIDGATAYSKEAVEAALPGHVALPVTMATEDRTLEALAVFREGLQVFQVVPGADGRVGAVHGVSASLRGPGGTRIGMSLAEAGVLRAACRSGTGNWAGMPICTAAETPNVTLVFALPGAGDATGAVDEATLRTATLQRIIWSPPAGSTS